MEEKKKKTAVTVTESMQIQALKIAKKQGINKFSTLIDILLANYINNNQDLIMRKQ